ncbi:MAG: hypothetical protein ACYC4N_25360 [Pirellulaceae bacterium]
MKRRKKILKWTGIVLGALVAIGLVANAVFVWTTDSRLERQLAAIRAAGDPVTLADLSRPPIPPQENAATYLRRAQADLAAIEKETRNLHPISECPGFLMPPEDQQTVKAALAAYPHVIPLLEQAAACPDYDAELDYTLPPEQFLTKFLEVAPELRLGARVLGHRATLLVAEGNHDEAVRTALLIFRLARHFDHNPLLIGYLVAIGVRGSGIQSAVVALQTGPISQEVRDALDTELAIQERMEGFAWALKSERSYMLSSFRNIVPGRNCFLVSRGVWNRRESACLEVLPALIALSGASRPYREVEQSIEVKDSSTAAFVSPAIEAGCLSVEQMRAEIRSLRVLNALQRRERAESNETPKLTELGLPIETTTDPFTGEPLHVEKTPQGWLIYSVGRNYRDDGGKLDDLSDGDVGVGPPPANVNPASGENGSVNRIPYVQITQPPFDCWKLRISLARVAKISTDVRRCGVSVLAVSTSLAPSWPGMRHGCIKKIA